MIASTDLKNGTTFLSGAKPYKVIKYNLIKVGRGGATVRVSARCLLDGSVEDKTFSSNVKVEEVKTSKKRLQYLYQDGANAVFMDPVSYEQEEVPVKVISSELPFMKEGEGVDIFFWNEGGVDKPLSVDIPPKVTLTISATDPGVKGNSASNVYKDAIVENGLKVRVPLFIKTGDRVKIDTRTGGYVERAK